MNSISFISDRTTIGDNKGILHAILSLVTSFAFRNKAYYIIGPIKSEFAVV